MWSRGVVPENKVATQVLPSRQNHKKNGEGLASLTCERLVFLGWRGRPVTRVESEAWVGLGPMTGCGRFGRFHVFSPNFHGIMDRGSTWTGGCVRRRKNVHVYFLFQAEMNSLVTVGAA